MHPSAMIETSVGLSSDQDDLVGLKNVELGMKMLTLAVLTILIAAPLGSILIMSTGPRFLKKSTKVGQAY